VFYCCGIYVRACCFEKSSRYAGWCAKEEFERAQFTVADHIAYAFYAAYIGYFVRIGYGGYRTMPYCHTGKGCGHQHRAFYMHMRINETGKYITLCRVCSCFNRNDDTIFYTKRCRVYPPLKNINKIA